MPDFAAEIHNLKDVLEGRALASLPRRSALGVCLAQLRLIGRQLDGADADTLAAFRAAWVEVFGGEDVCDE